MKENKGITLIALLVTIIIMLILIGVSMKIVIDGNLFPSAQNAVDKTNNKVAQQEDIVNGLMNEWDEIEKQQIISACTGHEWQDLETITDATCTTTGSKRQKCTKCQASRTIEIPALGHDYQNSTKFNATCTKCNDEKTLTVGDYVNYPVSYVNVSTYAYGGYTPQSKFAGKWRVISIETDTSGQNETYVRLVSAGIPLSFSYESGEGELALTAITTDFLITTYSNNGFTGSLTSLFNNDYTDSVQSMGKQDVDGVVGFTTDQCDYVNDSNYNDLLAIPIEENSDEYAFVYFATLSEDSLLWRLGSNGWLISSHSTPDGFGIRPVVSLKNTVVFTPSTININNTQTWDISI